MNATKKKMNLAKIHAELAALSLAHTITINGFQVRRLHDLFVTRGQDQRDNDALPLGKTALFLFQAAD